MLNINDNSAKNLPKRIGHREQINIPKEKNIHQNLALLLL
jgi:hypothetical protein